MTSRRVFRWLVLGVMIVFYAVPMLSMARFAFQRVPVILLTWDTLFSRWTIEPLVDAVTSREFRRSAFMTVRIALLTAIVTLLVLMPVLVRARLAGRRMRRVVELSAIIPFVVPAIALVVGVSGIYREWTPWLLRSEYSLVPLYFVTALPFAYRTLDNGLAAIDLRTLLEAAQSLGQRHSGAVVRVILPNMWASVSTTFFLVCTVVLGEFTIASLLLKNTLPLYLAYAQGQDPQGAFGIGLLLTLVSAIFLAVSARLSGRLVGTGVVR